MQLLQSSLLHFSSFNLVDISRFCRNIAGLLYIVYTNLFSLQHLVFSCFHVLGLSQGHGSFVTGTFVARVAATGTSSSTNPNSTLTTKALQIRLTLDLFPMEKNSRLFYILYSG